MKIIGTSGGVVTPYAILSVAGNEIPITSFQVNHTLGQLSVGRVGVPPQFLNDIPDEATQDLCEIRAGSDQGELSTIFTGYVSGPSGRKSSRSFTTGIDLIHPARDIDQMRLAAPSIHPKSIGDFDYVRTGMDFRSEVPPGQIEYYTGSGKFPEQVVKKLIEYLGTLSGATQTGDADSFPFKMENYGPAIKLLGEISFLNGTFRGFNGTRGSALYGDINSHLSRKIGESFQSLSSIWDTLTAAFADFGMILLCLPNGKVAVTADLANVSGGFPNSFDGEYIQGFDFNSVFFRNIKGVDLTTYGASKTSDFTEANGNLSLVESYSPGGDERGATMVLQFPSWLSAIAHPIRSQTEPEEPITSGNPIGTAPYSTAQEDAQIKVARTAYAKMLYGVEKNKMRTVSIVGPLAPLAYPGTCSSIDATDQIRARPTADITALSGVLYGYCYGVQHTMDRAAKISQSTFLFRNVTRNPGDYVDAHPFWSDAIPWKWS